jgi:hypothetical protein
LPKSKSEHPLCSATLKDASPCGHVAVEGDLCGPHARKAAKAAAEAEASGSSAGSNMGEAAASVVEESDPPNAEPGESVPVASLRGELRAGLMTEEVAGLIRDNIVAGLSSVKDAFVTCGKCKTRTPVSLPDLGTRVSAAEKLLDQLDGKLRAESASVEQKLSEAQLKAQQDLESLTDAELDLIVMASNDGEPASMKALARSLAVELLADADADPKGWLAERLSATELDFLERVSAHHYWGSFPSSLIELAAEVATGAVAA